MVTGWLVTVRTWFHEFNGLLHPLPELTLARLAWLAGRLACYLVTCMRGCFRQVHKGTPILNLLVDNSQVNLDISTYYQITNFTWIKDYWLAWLVVPTL